MTHTWNVAIHLFDADDLVRDGRMTGAHAVLTTSSGTSLEGYGSARRNPEDAAVPEIGEELAAARALRELADRLLRATSDDIAQIEHRPVHLQR
ncbi:dsRBD fold-containing protein [Promicromonospora sp. MEB111]|uniref:dsRBD fold-containing protein n=1 Tax=Promicromonospora sp. MEB111 TaxID=3040301 RepID=UPI00254F9334|nr:dsRBD fold-containing protein [Promicromonospora sp. MEB111]